MIGGSVAVSYLYHKVEILQNFQYTRLWVLGYHIYAKKNLCIGFVFTWDLLFSDTKAIPEHILSRECSTCIISCFFFQTRIQSAKKHFKVAIYQYHICVHPRDIKEPGPHLNIKTIFPGMEIPMLKIRLPWDRLVSYSPGMRDKRRVSEIDLSQPRHETAFWWHHNGQVTSQLTDPIKWPNYPLELIRNYVHMNTHSKESLTQRCRRSTNVHLCLIFLYISIWFES